MNAKTRIEKLENIAVEENQENILLWLGEDGSLSDDKGHVWSEEEFQASGRSFLIWDLPGHFKPTS